MDKLTKIILGVGAGLVVLGVVCIMSLMMKLSVKKEENRQLSDQIKADNVARQDDKVGAVEKQMLEALAKQQLENDKRMEALRVEMKATASSASADLKAVKEERAQLSETIAKNLREKEEKLEEKLTPLQKKIRDAPAIAKVIAVKEGLGFVVIDAGSAKGIEKGSRFNIRRDVFIVAEVEINDVVDADNSIGNIDSSKSTPGISIRTGDEVIGYPVF